MVEITGGKADPGETRADFGLEDLFGLIEDFGRSVLRDIHLDLERSALVKVTLQQMIICYFLMLHGGRMTVSDVANELGVSLSAITASANRMIRSGLLERLRDAADRRVVWLELTPVGREAVASFLGIRNRHLRRYFGSLSGEELDCLYRILRKLCQKR